MQIWYENSSILNSLLALYCVFHWRGSLTSWAENPHTMINSPFTPVHLAGDASTLYFPKSDEWYNPKTPWYVAVRRCNWTMRRV